MNTAPKKNPGAHKLTEALKAAPSRLWRRLCHNWGWKLLSLLLAVCLWAGLISQDPNLTRERRFTDVSVSLSGQDTLLRNGLIVLSGLEEENLRLNSFRAQVPQRSYDNASVSNYNPRIDLSRITETGEQDVKVLFTTSSTYGTVESADPSTFHIVVDEYVTDYRVPVTLNPVGEYPEGYYAATPIYEPSTVAVSGPKSLIDQLAYVQADYDRSSLSARAGTTRLALPLRFVNTQGEVMESRQLEAVSSNTVLRTITVEQRLYESKTLDVAYQALLSGEPARGYEVKSITATPSTVLAAGDATVLETIDSLFTDNPVSVEGLDESFTSEIRLRKPSELAYLSTNAATVYVEIGPIMINRDFTDIKIQVQNVPEGLKATLSQKTSNVIVSGPMLLVEALRSGDLRLLVDASGLEAGEHTLPIAVYLDGGTPETFQCTPQHLSVTVTLH